MKISKPNVLDLPALRKIAEAADRGEWLLSGHTKGYQGVQSSNDPSGWIVCPDDEYKVPADANAAHIAALNPTTAPQLLDLVERLSRENAIMRTGFDLIRECAMYPNQYDIQYAERIAAECLASFLVNN